MTRTERSLGDRALELIGDYLDVVAALAIILFIIVAVVWTVVR
jgi:hypothetical protein